MTCLCGDYDYIESTVQTLSNAMTYHRDQGNRIIYEYLTGSLSCRRWTPVYSVNEYVSRESSNCHLYRLHRLERAKEMRLYQYAARCPSALRTFLDGNPRYWCFIPRPCNETMLNNFNCLGEPRE